MTKRSYCGQLREGDVGQKVLLKGWVHRLRDHGGKKFIDLRDKKGLVQVIFDPEKTENFEKIESVGREYLLEVKGKVKKRPEGGTNSKLKTGKVEVKANSFEVISSSEPTPFSLDEEKDLKTKEETRLENRYLDLRREELQKSMKTRYNFSKSCRRFLDDNEFIEIETPYLTKSTPEGARDFIVPSRNYKGNFYALPQSPQLFKQLIMISGFERYFQFVKCFRDEDSRKDRQPEFTQLDIEVSFLDQEEFLAKMESMFVKAAEDTYGVEFETPVQRMTYPEAMKKYGTDRPDLRFGLELKDLTETVRNCDFNSFSNVVSSGGMVKGINVKKGAKKLSNKEKDELDEFAENEGAMGLVKFEVKENKLKSSLSKHFQEETLNKIGEKMQAEDGDLLLIVADTNKIVNQVLSQLRLKLGEDLDLIDEDDYELLWVVDMPMFEFENDEFKPMHHPFTSPKGGVKALEQIDPDNEQDREKLKKMTADAYDLVLNGEEIGGGSKRIHTPKAQEKVFDILDLEEEEVEQRFGWFLEAFKYGPPPHRGIAFGLDRIIMIFRNQSSIRDVIAFPKNKNGYSPLTGAPASPRRDQLNGLGISVDNKKEEK